MSKRSVKEQVEQAGLLRGLSKEKRSLIGRILFDEIQKEMKNDSDKS